MTPLVDISIEADAWEQLGDLEALVERAVLAAVKVSAVKLHAGAEVSLMLCDDAAIRVLNRDWRKIDKATNVLSFPGAGQLPRRLMLGDIAIAFETTAAEALAEGKSIQNHFTHLVVHGFLHLLGMDHETAAEAEAMEAAERSVLAELGLPDPYAGTVPLEAEDWL